ncbi:DUF6279 family lipoprotein [Kangiella marina]|uniref:DUF6279 family lipoprotein n=2 Tax=Kangiella marina TaxID=1079178 RepID=A0ABP8IED8_9GAMM
MLQGCGFQFWYNRIAWVSTWYADDYVTLSSAQEERIESLVEQHAYWHRTTQLPRYNQFIDDVIADLNNKTVAENYDSYGERLLSFYYTILDKVLDDAVNELAQLNDEQVDELMDNINASAQKERQEFSKQTSEERREKAIETTIESYQEWFDDLSSEQETLIIELVNKIQPTTELRLDYLKEWRNAFSLALAERQSESGQKALRSLLRNPRQLRSSELIKLSDANDALRKKIQLTLFTTLSDEQVEHFIEYLNEYREDFSELVQDAD